MSEYALAFALSSEGEGPSAGAYVSPELLLKTVERMAVVNVDRHLSPFLREENLLSVEKRGFTLGNY